MTRDRAEALDAADPLAGFRERFVAGEGIYLDGNSLGRLPVATRERLHALIDQWGSELVGGWHEWIDLPQRAGALLATQVLGAAEEEVIVTDSTTVNLFKLANAAIDLRGLTGLVSDRGNFPTDRYVLEGIAAARGIELRLFDSDPLEGPQPADLHACGPEDLVVLSHVAYRSGALADMAAITASTPATVIWDLSHSVGAVPIALGDAGAELAVGCTYKYLNGGPGAPAFLYVAEKLQGELRSPIWGWFAQSEQFAMDRPYDPVPGAGRFLAGTPPILQLAAADEGIRLTAEAGMERIREKSVALTELIVELHDAWLAPLGFELGTPRDPARRGSHVSLRHELAWPITRALLDAGVTPDFRGPDSIRLGVAPLYTRFTEVYDALDTLRGIVERGELPDAAPARVT